MADTVIAISATPDDPSVALMTDGDPHAPTASYSLVERAVALSRERGATVHVGSIVSAALFYDPRPNMMQKWRDRGHLAVEMEAAMLYTLGAIHKIETLCIVTISDIISADEGTAVRISDAELKTGVDRMMEVACDVAIG